MTPYEYNNNKQIIPLKETSKLLIDFYAFEGKFCCTVPLCNSWQLLEHYLSPFDTTLGYTRYRKEK